MKPEDVYEQWKGQRSSIEAPAELEANVMSSLHGLPAPSGAGESVSRPTAGGLLAHPALAAVAVVAASFVGIMRVTFALLIGILQ